MELYSLKAAYSLADQLYGATPSESDFEDIALNGWELINNKHTRLYRYVGDVVNHELALPCNVAEIESVHIPVEDAQITSNKRLYNAIDTLYIEGYIEAWKTMEDPLYTPGKLIKYDEGNNVLYFSHDYQRVMVVYKGIIADEDDGLPLVNNKELRAIAAYVAYAALYKESIKKRDGDLMKLTQVVKEDWLRLCNSARIPEHMSQNDMNDILDVVTRWDRKSYGKSLKPIL